MTSVEHYRGILDAAFLDTESLSILVAAGATLEEVATALEVQLDVESDEDADTADESAYALTDIPGGVLAIELSGFADPSRSALQAITAGGRSAATVRSNIKAHIRFGCARNGEILFDDHEYAWVDDRDRVPEELRELFDLAWEDPEVEVDEEDEDFVDPFVVGLAMVEVITGLRITADDLERASESGFHPAPSMRYVGELD